MIERLPFLWPEIILFATTCVVMVMGLSPRAGLRRLTAPTVAVGLAAAMAAALRGPSAAADALLPAIQPFAKAMIAGVGLLLVLVQAGVVDRDEDARLARGGRFDSGRSTRAEYWSFFLFSLTGAMLCSSATDLIWLFLALELTSLPTYLMVTISGRGPGASLRSHEAGVKYFFLGALGAAVFLFGFALIYGGTGATSFTGIGAAMAVSPGPIATAGLLLSLLGLSFKIAAVPMHFYAADVYEGAASPVSAFLAFVPKAAGFIAILQLAAAAGWTHGEQAMQGGGSLPSAVRVLLWVMAAATMTVGNVLALRQASVKRILAYSSVAHSGYMLAGVIAGPGDGSFAGSGPAALLFYLLAYGLTNAGAFAVVACLERRSSTGEDEEAASVDDLRGLCATRPWLGWTMVACSLSLMGFPPILGFFAKLPLFTSSIAAGEIPLVVVLGVNSAIGAVYYLRLAMTPIVADPDAAARLLRTAPFPTRHYAAVVSAVAAVAAAVAFGGPLMRASAEAARVNPPLRQSSQAGGGAQENGPALGRAVDASLP